MSRTCCVGFGMWLGRRLAPAAQSARHRFCFMPVRRLPFFADPALALKHAISDAYLHPLRKTIRTVRPDALKQQRDPTSRIVKNEH